MYVGYCERKGSKSLGEAIKEFNDRLNQADRENRVRSLKATIETLKLDLQRLKRGQIPLYGFNSKDEMELAICSLENSLLSQTTEDVD